MLLRLALYISVAFLTACGSTYLAKMRTQVGALTFDQFRSDPVFNYYHANPRTAIGQPYASCDKGTIFEGTGKGGIKKTETLYSCDVLTFGPDSVLRKVDNGFFYDSFGRYEANLKESASTSK